MKNQLRKPVVNPSDLYTLGPIDQYRRGSDYFKYTKKENTLESCKKTLIIFNFL